jgi:hypothetical protein
MSETEEQQLYAELWKLTKNLALEQAPDSKLKAIRLIKENCTSLPYPDSVDLYISLAQAEFPRMQEEEYPSFLSYVANIFSIFDCCAEHKDIDRQLQLEKIIEKLKQNASSNNDLEQELFILDILKIIKARKERAEKDEGGVVTREKADMGIEKTGISTTTADTNRLKVSPDDSTLLDLISLKYQVDYLDKRTESKFTDMQGRIEDKFSNKYLMIALIVTIFIGIIGILIAILVSLPK